MSWFQRTVRKATKAVTDIYKRAVNKALDASGTSADNKQALINSANKVQTAIIDDAPEAVVKSLLIVGSIVVGGLAPTTGKTKSTTMEKSTWWSSTTDTILSGVGSYFQSKNNAQAQTQQSAINAGAISDTVKFLGILAVAGTVIGLIFKLIK